MSDSAKGALPNERRAPPPANLSEAGKVPGNWTVKRLKFLGDVRSGVAKGKVLGDKDTVTLPYLRVANVQDGYVDLQDVSELEVAASEATRYLLRKHDVLMNEGGDNDKLGRGAVWQGQIDPCIHQNHVFAVRLANPEIAEWVSRFTSTDAARAYFFLRSKQSTNLASINQSDVRELPVPMPPDDQRVAIIKFLDEQTARIDALIAEKEGLVLSLAHYAESVIADAVLGSAHTARTLVHVPEIGSIPQTWRLAPMMRLTDVQRPIMYGIVLPGPNVETGPSVPIVKGGDVRPHRLRLDLLNRTTPEIEAPYARARLRARDIVYSIRGTIGDAELVPPELEGANITQDVARISPSADVEPRWLLYAAKSRPVFAQLEQLSLGAAVRGINIFDLKRARVPLPPFEEQVRIADGLDSVVGKVEALRSHSKVHIDRLREYRSSLISAAVAGALSISA